MGTGRRDWSSNFCRGRRVRMGRMSFRAVLRCAACRFRDRGEIGGGEYREVANCRKSECCGRRVLRDLKQEPCLLILLVHEFGSLAHSGRHHALPAVPSNAALPPAAPHHAPLRKGAQPFHHAARQYPTHDIRLSYRLARSASSAPFFSAAEASPSHCRLRSNGRDDEK